MGRFNKRVIGGLTAALTLAAGGAFAGEYLITNFDNGTNQHNMGYYYYSYGSGNPNQGNVTERGYVVSAGPADEYGPMSYLAQGPEDGSACYSGQYCGALRVSPLPQEISAATYTGPELNDFQVENGYYPAFGFGMSLTKDDLTGYGDDFAKVDSIAFYAKTTTAGVEVYFKVETTENSPKSTTGCGGACQGYRTDFPDVDKTNHHTNAYMKSFSPTTSWARYAFAIKPVSGTDVTAITTATGMKNTVGDLKQAPWYGYNIAFQPKNVTKLAWAINSDAPGNSDLQGNEANVYIDDVVLVGSQINPDFYVAPWNCKSCVSETLAGPGGSFKWLSRFEGNDDGESTIDYLRNSRGYYWYSYDDKVGGGSSQVLDLIPNPHLADNMIMNTAEAGRAGRGATILFETALPYEQDGKTVGAFVGIGANLYHDTTSSDYYDASAFEGIYFEYRTTWPASADYKVSVELTDDFDAALVGGAFGVGKPAADKDGEVFFCQVPGTGERWNSVKIPFTKFVLPAWVETNGTRRGPGTGVGETLNKAKLAGLKFKVEGTEIIEQRLSIDNVLFYGSGTDTWDLGSGVRFANGAKAKAAGMRATYNRGVVGVSWSAANIENGRVSLINVKGRTVASAQLVKSGSKVTANLGKGKIPTGMYFVRINAKDVQGRKVVQQVPLSVVK